MANEDKGFVPTNTVLEVQDGSIDAAAIFERIDKNLNLKLKQEESEHGKDGS